MQGDETRSTAGRVAIAASGIGAVLLIAFASAGMPAPNRAGIRST
jgi:hypothetical protein